MNLFNKNRGVEGPEERAAQDELDKKIFLDAGFILLHHTAWKQRPEGERAIDPTRVVDIYTGKDGTWVTRDGQSPVCVVESAGEVLALIERFKQQVKKQEQE